MRESRILTITCLTTISVSTLAFPSVAKSLTQRAKDAKVYTAIGDSYAAGIGAGKVLDDADDKKCSRYDGAYSTMIHEFLGEQYTYQSIACSGDLSDDIRKQAQTLKDNSQDLVTISAGGNDALLSEVLKQCIFLPASQQGCDEALKKSQNVIDHELHGNIVLLLQTLAPKMKKSATAVYTLYGQFFNADTDACSKQTWNFLEELNPYNPGLKLTKEIRTTLNTMVAGANKVIKSAISEFTSSSHGPSMKVAVADWDAAAGAAKGRFCEEGSANNPSDPSNEGLVFLRPNTSPVLPPTAKEVQGRAIDKRIPDDIARYFHPTPLGHKLIATYALTALADAETNGQAPPQKCMVKQPETPQQPEDPYGYCN